MRLCALSVDLDEDYHYHAIHGLEVAAPAARPGPVYSRALERFIEWARVQRIPLTFFVIGADARYPENAERLRALVKGGHELGNHTLEHRYDLVRLSQGELRRQVEEGARAIEAASGRAPRGFRAPGYTVSDRLLDLLEQLGVAYDSSVFPCPPYWGAKALALSVIRARGRASRSILDTPRVLTAPTTPYRVGRPYWRRGSGLLEVPIQVTRGLRLPFIGTTLSLAGQRGARALARMVVGSSLVNLELHGIDVLDRSDGLASIAAHQPDVRIPSTRKLESLTAAVTVLRDAGYAFVRLDEAAARIAATLAHGSARV